MRLLMFVGWLVGAALAGAGLYGIAYEVEQLEAQLAALEQDIRREHEATRTLEAEWAYLARPDRMAELSRRYLPELHSLSAARLARIEDIPVGPRRDGPDAPASSATKAAAVAARN